MRAWIISGLAGLAGMLGVVGLTQAGPLGPERGGSPDGAAQTVGTSTGVDLERRLERLARAQRELDRTLTESSPAVALPVHSLPVGTISSRDHDEDHVDADRFEDDDDGRGRGRGRGRGGDDDEDDD